MSNFSISVQSPSISVPASLEGLVRLAGNFYWTWQPAALAVFEKVHPGVAEIGAVRALRESTRLDALSADPAFVAEVQGVVKAFDAYMASDRKLYRDPEGLLANGPIAYFCAEYGLYEAYNQYAGGLGILAGDHCKEASDLNLPFVGIGLFYRRGFFFQRVDWEGRQESIYPVIAPEDCPIQRVLNPGTQEPLFIEVEMPGRNVRAAVWLAPVGRMPLLLLDTDVEGNSAGDRAITSQLYTNWRSMRLHQEMILGVGGVRALRALGIAPTVWHMNEGHSALLILEQLREKVASGLTLAKAQAEVTPHAVLTIHTPVPEGNERFDATMMKQLIAPMLEASKIAPAAILKLGLDSKADRTVFDMTAFALRHSSAANGVSLLHGRTADKTWRKVVGRPVIGVTNGVHMPTWVGPEIKKLLATQALVLRDSTEAPCTPNGLDGRPRWESALQLDDTALWKAHRQQKEALIAFAKDRLFELYARHGMDPAFLNDIVSALDPNAFLIGFSRRFATYKRANLLFSDIRRAAKLLHHADRPVQIIFSGKAHPNDRSGQDLIAKVYQLTQEPIFRGRVFLLEDYNIEIGRMLVQGSDVWLNNPRRPLEASGTSGMKAAANGVPNASILDGWWDEACDLRPGFQNGFAIGNRANATSVEGQDKRDGANLYRTLEREVIPMYFDRDASGLPREWLKVMKNSIASSLYDFSTARMIDDYLDRMYLAASKG